MKVACILSFEKQCHRRPASPVQAARDHANPQAQQDHQVEVAEKALAEPEGGVLAERLCLELQEEDRVAYGVCVDISFHSAPANNLQLEIQSQEAMLRHDEGISLVLQH